MLLVKFNFRSRLKQSRSPFTHTDNSHTTNANQQTDSDSREPTICIRYSRDIFTAVKLYLVK
jgi:hypothetical protein